MLFNLNICKMRKTLLFALVACFVSGLDAQELKPLKLNKPDVKRGLPVMTALEKRHSEREFSDKKLNMQDLSDLLWAANGINRPASAKRTAPSALNKQEIEVYVCMPEGTYRYNAKTHSLLPVTKEDLRPAVAGSQGFVKQAPLCLVLVADLEKFNGEVLMPAMDAGIVSQNINLFCAGMGLVTVPRASMDQAALKKGLKLKDSQRPLMNNPVGYAK